MTAAVTVTTVPLTGTAVPHPAITMTAVPHPGVLLPVVPRHDIMMIVGMEAAVATMMTVVMETGEVGRIDMVGTATWRIGTGDLVMGQGGHALPVRTTEIKGPDETIGAGVGHTKDRDTKAGRAGHARQEVNWNIPYKFGIVPVYCK